MCEKLYLLSRMFSEGTQVCEQVRGCSFRSEHEQIVFVHPRCIVRFYCKRVNNTMCKSDKMTCERVPRGQVPCQLVLYAASRTGSSRSWAALSPILSSVKYLRAVTVCCWHEYSACLIHELDAVSGPSLALESAAVLRSTSRRFVNQDYACHR